MRTARRVTAAQLKELRRQMNQGASLRKAAMKANMDPKSARKYRRLNQLPDEARKMHTWRTRGDPLASVWPELEELLQREPELPAVTLLGWLQTTYPRKKRGRSSYRGMPLPPLAEDSGPADETFSNRLPDRGQFVPNGAGTCLIPDRNEARPRLFDAAANRRGRRLWRRNDTIPRAPEETAM